MPASSDSSHASNVTSLQALLTSCTYMGADYNPGPAAIKLTGLQTLLAGAQARLNDISNAAPVYDAAVSQRAAAFAALPELATRCANTLAAYSPNSPVAGTVRTLLRKIRGGRASQPVLNPDGTPAPTISVAQLTYDNKVKHFEDLVNALETDPLYLPDDATLTIVALQAVAANLRARNLAVLNSLTPLTNARGARDVYFYNESNGLTTVAQQAKAYVKGRFGVSSPQYRQVSGLRFRKLK